MILYSSVVGLKHCGCLAAYTCHVITLSLQVGLMFKKVCKAQTLTLLGCMFIFLMVIDTFINTRTLQHVGENNIMINNNIFILI